MTKEMSGDLRNEWLSGSKIKLKWVGLVEAKTSTSKLTQSTTMTNWEQLLATPDYTSDTGNGPRSGTDHLAGGEFKLGNQSGPDAITLEEAFTRIGRMAGGPMLLVKTIAWAGHPGAYYAKAFVSKGAEWNTLNKVLKDNQEAGLFKVRKSWVCGPGRCWN
jgi:hypothetical protein